MRGGWRRGRSGKGGRESGGAGGQKEEARVSLSKYKPVKSYIVSWRVLGMSTLQSMLHTTVSTEFNFSTFSLLVFSSHHHGNNIFLLNTSLIPSPLPAEESPGTRCLHMREVFHYIFCKKAEDTNQEYRAFFDIDSSNNLTYRIDGMGYYFSDVAISFFQTYSPTER